MLTTSGSRRQRLRVPRRRSVNRFRRLPLWIAVTVLLIVVGYPLIWLLLGSFKSQREFLEEPT